MKDRSWVARAGKQPENTPEQSQQQEQQQDQPQGKSLLAKAADLAYSDGMKHFVAHGAHELSAALFSQGNNGFVMYARHGKNARDDHGVHGQQQEGQEQQQQQAQGGPEPPQQQQEHGGRSR